MVFSLSLFLSLGRGLVERTDSMESCNDELYDSQAIES